MPHKRPPVPPTPPPDVDPHLLDRWKLFLFDRSDGEWGWDDAAADPIARLGSPRHTAAYLTALFRSGPDIARRFSRDAIGWATWYVFGTQSEHCWALRDRRVPLAERVAGIRAVGDLYRDCYDPLCRPTGRPGEHPDPGRDTLANAVYMIWDMDVIEGAAMDGAEADSVDAVFDLLADALRLRSLACVKSGLHGLGHLHFHHPERVERTIAAFLARTDLPRGVRDYADAARIGAVQ